MITAKFKIKFKKTSYTIPVKSLKMKRILLFSITPLHKKCSRTFYGIILSISEPDDHIKLFIDKKSEKLFEVKIYGSN